MRQCHSLAPIPRCDKRYSEDTCVADDLIDEVSGLCWRVVLFEWGKGDFTNCVRKNLNDQFKYTLTSNTQVSLAELCKYHVYFDFESSKYPENIFAILFIFCKFALQRHCHEKLNILEAPST